MELKDEDVHVRRTAIRALEEYQGEHVTSALADAINDADNQVRRLAIHALGQRGDQARAHLPTLEMALKDSDPQIGRDAAIAIQAIDPVNKSFVPVLVEALHDGRHEIFLEVETMGPEAQWAVPALIELLSHRKVRIRALSALTLGQLESVAREAIPALRQAESDPQVTVRKMAQQAIELIESP